MLASGSFDGTVRLWSQTDPSNSKSWKCIRVIEICPEPVVAIGFAPKGDIFVAGTYHGKLVLVDTNTWATVESYRPGKNEIPLYLHSDFTFFHISSASLCYVPSKSICYLLASWSDGTSKLLKVDLNPPPNTKKFIFQKVSFE